MANGTAFSAWLSGPLLDKALERSNEVAKGNNSAYVKSLIQRDVNGAAAPVPDENLIVELAKKYHPAAEPTVRSMPSLNGAGEDQRIIVFRLLDALVRAAEGYGFDPKQPFDLVAAGKATEAMEKLNAQFVELASIVSELQSDYSKPKKSRRRKSPTPPSAPGQIKLQPHDRSQPA